MLRRDLQVAADVMGNQFLDVRRRTDGKVVAQAGTDQDALDALDGARRRYSEINGA